MRYRNRSRSAINSFHTARITNMYTPLLDKSINVSFVPNLRAPNVIHATMTTTTAKTTTMTTKTTTRKYVAKSRQKKVLNMKSFEKPMRTIGNINKWTICEKFFDLWNKHQTTNEQQKNISLCSRISIGRWIPIRADGVQNFRVFSRMSTRNLQVFLELALGKRSYLTFQTAATEQITKLSTF